MEPPQTRQQQRCAWALRCELQAADGKLQTAVTKDLSRSGLSLVVAQPVAISTAVGLKVAALFSDRSSSAPLRLEATIIWCTPVGEGYQLGAKFARISEELQRQVEMLMNMLQEELEGSSDGPGRGP